MTTAVKSKSTKRTKKAPPAPPPKQELTIYARKDDVLQLQQRIMAVLPTMLPGSANLTPLEAFALAQVALLHRLSPFNGEIYFLKKSDGTALGIMPGIRGYRKTARKQLSRVSPQETFSIEYLPVSPKEAGCSDEKAVCWKAVLRDSVTMRNYMANRKMASDIVYGAIIAGQVSPLKDKGVIDPAAIKELNAEVYAIVGQPPVVIAYGVVTSAEFERMQKARLSIPNQARIRAERQAIRQRFDLEMLGDSRNDNDASALDEVIDTDQYIDGSVVTEEKPAAPKQSVDQNLKDLGY
jgi:hypothetical protein